MLVVQVVEILWTKATRGAPRSNERVALPRAFSIEVTSCACAVQHYRIAEWESFQPTLVKSDAKDSVPGSVGLLHILQEPNGHFRLGLVGTPEGGQPRRHERSRAIHLAAGEYARLSVNARHTSYSGQYYSETVFNVASGEHVPSNRFLLSSPNHELDLKANLF